VPGVTRTLAEAESMARRVLAAAEDGAVFAELVRLYGDDRTNDGVLAIANFGVSPASFGELERVALARDFGDAAFALDVGDVRLVRYHEDRSPFGYHVLTRLR